jgi:glycosyltransferase involved in cell wall biosynthesis
MTGPAPDISIVVPTYNRPEALRRLLAALAAQRGVAFETIVVDDGGAVPLGEVTADLAGPARLRLLRQDNAGPAAARNRGAAAARAAVLAFTDDDCAPHPGWAAAMVRAVAAGATPVLVGGATSNAVRGNLFAEASQDIADFLSRPAGGRGDGGRGDGGQGDGGQGGAGPDFVASNNIAMPRAAFAELGGFDAAYPLAAGEDRAFCRAWISRGWAIAVEPRARVEHHHALDRAGFWRQHRNYGRGARAFHGSAEAAPFRPLARLGFYGRLVAHPFLCSPGWRGAARSGLMVMAQVAIVAGYMDGRGRD